MTRLRKLMLHQKPRSNDAEHRPCLYPRHRGFREVLPPFARSPRSEHIASTRFTCFATANSRRGPSKAAPLLCVFSSSRRSDGPIFPITFRFPSVRGGCPRY